MPSAMSFESTNPIHLKRAGLKATSPRMRILEVFRTSARRHLSAEDVYRKTGDNDYHALGKFLRERYWVTPQGEAL